MLAYTSLEKKQVDDGVLRLEEIKRMFYGTYLYTINSYAAKMLSTAEELQKLFNKGVPIDLAMERQKVIPIYKVIGRGDRYYGRLLPNSKSTTHTDNVSEDIHRNLMYNNSTNANYNSHWIKSKNNIVTDENGNALPDKFIHSKPSKIVQYVSLSLSLIVLFMLIKAYINIKKNQKP